ncbi:YgfZ/GcvT domain-containing protein [Bartonella rattimassiliensis]|uniref:Folate-binding protein YgfZ n=1 Tax=Bartonella rattimassiliensis 15908 TaxID=1094556 RepID=J0QU51_9HYPH|nr:folate-binding protein YgfZ [Bartonella rattimassiliensis]EJF86664.1 folate-binding protein YgfZ [Bartonella rattimassiliensis 15908]
MIEKQNAICLKNRAIIKITGEEATDFLQSLITTDVKKISPQEMFPGALLSPQGKILADFLIGKKEDGYLIDITMSLADTLYKRLLLYKLRKKIEIIQPFQKLVTVSWNNKTDTLNFDSSFVDKRFPQQEKIIRIYGKMPFLASEYNDMWNQLRIRYAIAESGQDYEIGKVFPHDINYDQINGLAFNKGCYIGQEIVSRMHHRRAARRRILIIKSQGELIPQSNIEAGTKVLGHLGTCVTNEALALMRIDHVKDAMDHNILFTVKNIPVTIHIAENMNFTFPEKIL